MKDFIELVRDMRQVQKEYFATRKKTALFAAKEIERKVDEYLMKFKNAQDY